MVVLVVVRRAEKAAVKAVVRATTMAAAAAAQVAVVAVVLAGEAVAAFAADAGVPMAFRSQRVDLLDPAEAESVPAGPCRAWYTIASRNFPHARLPSMAGTSASLIRQVRYLKDVSLARLPRTGPA